MTRLVVTFPGLTSAPYQLNEELITIGRATDNMIQIDDLSVSSRHAQLQRFGETYRLRDLDSASGTHVNGETIKEIALRIGDRVRFGSIETRFEVDASSESQPSPEPATVESKPSEPGARLTDFTSASPFPNRKGAKDLTRVAVLAAVAVALLGFLSSMIAILMMNAPI